MTVRRLRTRSVSSTLSPQPPSNLKSSILSRPFSSSSKFKLVSSSSYLAIMMNTTKSTAKSVRLAVEAHCKSWRPRNLSPGTASTTLLRRDLFHGQSSKNTVTHFKWSPCNRTSDGVMWGWMSGLEWRVKWWMSSQKHGMKDSVPILAQLKIVSNNYGDDGSVGIMRWSAKKEWKVTDVHTRFYVILHSDVESFLILSHTVISWPIRLSTKMT